MNKNRSYHGKFEEDMRVFEKRYLKRNSTGLCSGQKLGVCATELMGISLSLT